MPNLLPKQQSTDLVQTRSIASPNTEILAKKPGLMEKLQNLIATMRERIFGKAESTSPDALNETNDSAPNNTVGTQNVHCNRIVGTRDLASTPETPEIENLGPLQTVLSTAMEQLKDIVAAMSATRDRIGEMGANALETAKARLTGTRNKMSVVLGGGSALMLGGCDAPSIMSTGKFPDGLPLQDWIAGLLQKIPTSITHEVGRLYETLWRQGIYLPQTTETSDIMMAIVKSLPEIGMLWLLIKLIVKEDWAQAVSKYAGYTTPPGYIFAASAVIGNIGILGPISKLMEKLNASIKGVSITSLLAALAATATLGGDFLDKKTGGISFGACILLGTIGGLDILKTIYEAITGKEITKGRIATLLPRLGINLAKRKKWQCDDCHSKFKLEVKKCTKASCGKGENPFYPWNCERTDCKTGIPARVKRCPDCGSIGPDRIQKKPKAITGKTDGKTSAVSDPITDPAQKKGSPSARNSDMDMILTLVQQEDSGADTTDPIQPATTPTPSAMERLILRKLEEAKKPQVAANPPSAGPATPPSVRKRSLDW